MILTLSVIVLEVGLNVGTVSVLLELGSNHQISVIRVSVEARLFRS
jgi:hypothetical protein